jgi:predicted TPR repeat methyltransferase
MPGGNHEAAAADANTLFLQGNAHLQGGDLPNAVLKYRAALEADPKHADAWTNSELHLHPLVVRCPRGI